MKNKAHDATTYSFQKDEVVLIDTNVWLSLQPPALQSPRSFTQKYSLALKNLIAAAAKPVVEALVLSEYINRYLRLEFNSSWSLKYNGDFKKFRQSTDFTAIATAVHADSLEILKLATPRDTNLWSESLPNILQTVSTLDFNDGVLTEMCRKHSWKLLTHDQDFTEGGIEVLTVNQNLLAACR